ncbi:hypothetical protein SLEP1_g47248 [Rubroshorea leprosula]|uniref:Uncharacterized protein n=1 Tax=Rubroshorea leprosula TaxID=152421 RepID=A0AAV5LPR9_9ROSI|nr:hypothetical protein SLEP1_g47248 [Rubroshorea leprosula]
MENDNWAFQASCFEEIVSGRLRQGMSVSPHSIGPAVGSANQSRG